MQRLLVTLCLVLTLVVAVLAIVVFDLKDQVDKPNRRSGGGEARTVADTAEAARVKRLEQRVANLHGEIAGLRKELANAKARAAVGTPVRVDTGSDGETATPGSLTGDRRPRDGSGFVVTEEDEAFFRAVQKRVERTRRIDGTTRNLMRRVERQVRSGELQPMAEENLQKVETILRRYVVANDDLITRFVREQPPPVQALTPEERRNTLNDEREKIAAEAQRSLEQFLSPAEADLIAEKTLQRASSVRRKGMRARLNR